MAHKVNKKKFMNIIIYFCKHTNKLSQTKLWKLLYFLDFDFYYKNHKSITNDIYRKLEHGPAPKSGLEIIGEMILNGIIDIEPKRNYFRYYDKYIANKEYDLSLFSDEEKKEIEEIAIKYKDYNAQQMENSSHEDEPWKCTKKLYSDIDYNLVLYRNYDSAIKETEDEVDKKITCSSSFKKAVDFSDKLAKDL